MSLHFVPQNGFEGVGDELVSAALVELVLELDPMQSQGVQEAFKGVHAHKDAECAGEEAKPQSPELKNINPKQNLQQ